MAVLSTLRDGYAPDDSKIAANELLWGRLHAGDISAVTDAAVLARHKATEKAEWRAFQHVLHTNERAMAALSAAGGYSIPDRGKIILSEDQMFDIVPCLRSALARVDFGGVSLELVASQGAMAAWRARFATKISMMLAKMDVTSSQAAAIPVTAEVVAGLDLTPSEKEAFLLSDLYRGLMAELKKPSSSLAAIQRLLSAPSMSPHQRAALYGLVHHKPKNSADLLMKKVDVTSSAFRWNALAGALQVKFRSEALASLSAHTGVAGTRVVELDDAIPALRLVLDVDTDKIFDSHLYMFSPHKRVFEDKLSLEAMTRGQFFDSIKMALRLCELVWGLKVAPTSDVDEAYTNLLDWANKYEEVDPGCMTWEGGYLGIFRRLPLKALREEAKHLRRQLRVGTTRDPVQWQRALSKATLRASHASLSSPYFLALDALDRNTDLPKADRACLKTPAALHGLITGFDIEGAMSKIKDLETLMKTGKRPRVQNTAASGGNQDAVPVCPVCGDAHTRKQCTVKCEHCLRPGHKPEKCRVKCYTCGGKHREGDPRCKGADGAAPPKRQKVVTTDENCTNCGAPGHDWKTCPKQNGMEAAKDAANKVLQGNAAWSKICGWSQCNGECKLTLEQCRASNGRPEIDHTAKMSSLDLKKFMNTDPLRSVLDTYKTNRGVRRMFRKTMHLRGGKEST